TEVQEDMASSGTCRTCAFCAKRSSPGAYPSAKRENSTGACLKHHHGPEHFTPLHLVERLFNFIQSNGLRHEPFEVEPTLQIQVDKHREIACGETVAIPRRLERSASAKHL